MQNTILLADDDPAVRRMLCRVLAEENYCVIPVHDADDALRKFKNVRVDLVVLDLALPTNATDLFFQLKSERPSVPVILISSQRTENPLNVVGIRIEKPFDVSNLLRTIGKLLHEKIEV
jgi:two-component system, NtrC family, nitrogen regulation response regulator GlnG